MPPKLKPVRSAYAVPLKVVLFGASGMVGQGVLRECLADPRVEAVLSIARTASLINHPKFSEIILKNIESDLTSDLKITGWNACFFCLGTPSAGKTEKQYRRVTHDLTLSVASFLSKHNPQMTLIYVSGLGADSTEKKSPLMWARVRGQTENALQRLPFRRVLILRPGIILPMHGIQSKTATYRRLYTIFKPILRLARFVLPNFISSTEQIGRAMIEAAETGVNKPILGPSDFEELARRSPIALTQGTKL